MKQAILYPNGTISLETVPAPVLQGKGVVVQTHYSAISPGTEIANIKNAEENIFLKLYRRGTLLKAIQKRLRPGYLIQAAKQKGIPERSNILPTPIGYSSAGVVIESNCDIPKGTAVACMGAGHAEFSYIPRNLCAPVEADTDLSFAAWGALGCIAMHGVHRAEARPGENIVVMGMGILGQIAVQLLKKKQARVFAIDLMDSRLDVGSKLGADFTINALELDPVTRVKYGTNGFGADKVIICASSQSPIPIEQAFEMTREKGKIVIVGDVRLDVPRKPFYTKEIDLVISRSYGPGRYDSFYENTGLDYPEHHVKWTQNRNLQEFIRLITSGDLDLSPLISVKYPHTQINKAYEQIRTHAAQTLGAVLQYEPTNKQTVETKIMSSQTLKNENKISVALIGAGAFAQNYHLPNLSKNSSFQLTGIVTLNEIHAKSLAQKYNVSFCTTRYQDVFEDPDVDCVFITTRHNQHAGQVIEALQANKHVFVEKPIAMSQAECQEIIKVRKKNPNLKIGIGFNRRFSSLTQEAVKILRKMGHPVVINYRVASMPIPKGHWISDPVEGGGRILGESIHFLDLMAYLADSEPVDVIASGKTLNDQDSAFDHENYNIQLTFKNGSLGHLIQTDLSSRNFPKERIEIFAGGLVLTIDNFETFRMFEEETEKEIQKDDKGFSAEIESFAAAINEDKIPMASETDGIRATLCALAAIESMNSGQRQTIDQTIYLDKTD